MTLQPLTWSEPRATGWATITADEGDAHWRITPVPRDVTRISYTGTDADGTLVDSMEHIAYAETKDEALIVIDILRAGTDHLPGWRDQLEAAGFTRTYPEAPEGDGLSQLWHDDRESGLFQITVHDGSAPRNASDDEISVHATYESEGATFWHNVVGMNMCHIRGRRTFGDVTMRDGLPEGVDPLKAGVAAAIAIRAARTERGGRFATPLGGATKNR